MSDRLGRRALLRAAGAASVALAGCTGSGGGGVPPEADVVAGPDGALVFDPEEVTVAVGESVAWYFASRDHNVCGVPAHHQAVSIPDGAAPFSSYEGDQRYVTHAVGDTYEHTFETPGRYHCVCVPHAPQMAGTVTVTDSE